MNTPTIKLEDPANVLLEFIEVLVKIKVTPEKIKHNSETMTGANGEVITY